MSRDGYLPRGCTDRDVDMAAPGYYDDPKWEEEQRRIDLVENLQQWVEDYLTELLAHGEAARVRRICTAYLDKAS